MTKVFIHILNYKVKHIALGNLIGHPTYCGPAHILVCSVGLCFVGFPYTLCGCGSSARTQGSPTRLRVGPA
jgi:hypothetical protein